MKDGHTVENLDPSRQDISDSLKQVLSGLSSIINGLAAMKNRMPDAHGMAYKPSRHHAEWAVNQAETHADFIVDSLSYSIGKGGKKTEIKNSRRDSCPRDIWGPLDQMVVANASVD